ncbi:MAG TPA: hypothetical protein VK454_01920, partial [Myxococcaceae bacterium]|nr:hypothetical protein [Myxococcaceae bacterium]
MHVAVQLQKARGRAIVALAVAAALVPGRAGAWIYPEHRDIMAKALEDLPPAQKQFFAQLWTE